MSDNRRVRTIKPGQPISGPVIYAMSRDQRADDNWALLFAQGLAIERKQPLIVACPIAADYPYAPQRQTDFMIMGLRQVESRLKRLSIPLVVTAASPVPGLLSLVASLRAGALVTDFSPLRESRRWKTSLVKKATIPLYEVDAHNIVPAWVTSDKQEYAAYTIRPKIKRQHNEYLSSMPSPVKHPFPADETPIPRGWSTVDTFLDINTVKRGSMFFEPGEAAAQRQLNRFLTEQLERYNDVRNDPTIAGQSNLSPYLHSGQLSAQRVAWEAQRFDVDIASQESFLEELIVRRELADNLCLYNANYDSFEGFPEWAQATLHDHLRDPRPQRYDRDRLETASTHDELWNAAQTEMVLTAKMHGYLRMYWAKKILEWSPSPQEALAHAIFLNNRYEIDGHDPNGYAGIAWSIGGVHDRAWPEREIFGKIRYMSYDGCKRKFRVEDYINRIAALRSGVTA